MAEPQAIDATYCGGTTRKGTSCTLPAGKGTDHEGHGRCKHHGGCTPNGEKHGARMALQSMALEMGADVAMRPEELMLFSVRQAARMLTVAQQLASHPDARAIEDGHPSIVWLIQGEAIDRAAAVSRQALAAGIAERQVRIAERTAAVIAAAIERALAHVPLPVEQRAEFARRVETELLLLEQGEGEDVVEGSAA